MGATIQCEREGPLALIHLGGGSSGDLLDADSVDQLRRVTLSLTDAPPKAVILTGTSERFCSGMDLALTNPTIQRLEQQASLRDAFAIQETLRGVRGILTGLGRIPCPVIAAIEGPSLDAGFDLALACDMRFASETSIFGFPGIAHGMMPMGGGLVHLHRMVGRGRATQIALSGATLSAQRALDLGLLSELCPPGQTVARARAEIAHLLQLSPSAIQQTILALRRFEGSSEDFDIETQSTARAISTGELFRNLRGQTS